MRRWAKVEGSEPFSSIAAEIVSAAALTAEFWGSSERVRMLALMAPGAKEATPMMRAPMSKMMPRKMIIGEALARFLAFSLLFFFLPPWAVAFEVSSEPV